MPSSKIDSIYARYAPLALRRALAILDDPEAAKDIVQEIFVQLLRSPALLEGVTSAVSYFYQATTYACLNRLRDSARRGRHLETYVAHHEPVVRETAAEDRILLRRLLAAVPEELQTIAVYYYVDQMSQDEIADLVGVSRRTVGYRLEMFRQLAEANL